MKSDIEERLSYKNQMHKKRDIILSRVILKLESHAIHGKNDLFCGRDSSSRHLLRPIPQILFSYIFSVFPYKICLVTNYKVGKWKWLLPFPPISTSLSFSFYSYIYWILKTNSFHLFSYFRSSTCFLLVFNISSSTSFPFEVS